MCEQKRVAIRLRRFMEEPPNGRLSSVVSERSGHHYSAYFALTQLEIRDEPRRLLTDLIIGSHALAQADRLTTLDPR